MFNIEIANCAAVFNLYLYLAKFTSFTKDQTLFDAFKSIDKSKLKQKDSVRYTILKAAITSNPTVANAFVTRLILNENGLSACVIKTTENTFVVFKGTGKGEWIDNGAGLSGIAEQNEYLTYDKSGNIQKTTVEKDFASNQQAEALNLYNYIVNTDDLSENIIVTGHSKGGNKAQFVAINTDNVLYCISFNGQGFSPEAAMQFKDNENYRSRCQKIYSISTQNDYINVLGEQIYPPENKYYVSSCGGFHPIDSMLNKNGELNPITTQGELSKYAESVSKKLLRLPPSRRASATNGVMNVFQNIFGENNAVNGDDVTLSQTLVGLSIAIDTILRK